MKPSFALNLREDGVTLLHRTSRGWLDVGSVAFDDPDLGAALEYLRSTALGLSPKGITTKLIIPESQILYLQVDAVGPDDTSRRAQIEAELDGRTPYALDELVYDWTGDGPVVTVAVVARETLAEAEGFANEHRLNPVSFVACPETTFDKEPFFGPSSLAPSLLAGGEQVEADAEPVTIIAREMPRTDEGAVVGDEAPAPPAEEDLESDESAPQEPEAIQPEPEVSEPEVPDPEPSVPEPVLPEPVLPEPVLPVPVVPEPVVPEPLVPDPVLPGSEPEVSAPHVSLPETSPVYDPEPELPRTAAQEALPAEPVRAPVHQSWQDPAPLPGVATENAGQPAQPAFDLPPLSMGARAPKSLGRDAAAEDEPEAPMAVDVPVEDAGESVSPPPAPKPASVLSVEPAPLDELPPPPSAAAMMAFSSRRPSEGTPRPLGAAEADSGRPESSGARPAPLTATRPLAARPVVERPAAARPAPKFSYDDPVPPPPRLPGDPPTPPASVMNKASKGLRSLGTLVSAPSIAGSRKKKPMANGVTPVARPAAAAPPLAPGSTLAAPVEGLPSAAGLKAASQSLARQKPVSPDALARGLSARNMSQRGKPRYLGLILTGGLLLLLAIVAAWSSFYLTRAEDPPAEVQLAGLDDEALADGQFLDGEGDLLADLQPDDDLPVNVDLSDLALIPQPAPPEPPPPEDGLAEVALVQDARAIAIEPAPQTGVQDEVAAASQPAPATQDEIFLAGMDAPPALSDPLVLTAPAAQGDAPPAEQMPPPPFGTVYQFDENGRIVPTAAGILTPEGVMLVAGKPSVVPPQRSAAIEAAALAAAPPALTEAGADAVTAAVVEAVADPAAPPLANSDLLPAETFAADPTLSAARPRLRPEGLAPVGVNDDDASLAPAEDSRFASLRPRLRPPAVLAAGEAARQASEAASLAVQVAVAEAAAASAQDAALSPMAVSVSRVPAPRPRDLSRAVEAAVAAATRRPEPQAVAAAAPAAPTARAVAPEEDEADDEPEVATTAAPRIPTRANVAKQATFVNAINLGKINLIGVYGTQSKRYALVRQPNGRYRKVRVGDNIDGGRVQAITASEVRYQKGGRMLALSMPNG